MSFRNVWNILENFVLRCVLESVSGMRCSGKHDAPRKRGKFSGKILLECMNQEHKDVSGIFWETTSFMDRRTPECVEGSETGLIYIHCHKFT